MRIALDCRTVTQRKTGDRTYTLNLLRELAALESPHEFLLYTRDRSDLTDLPGTRTQAVVLGADPAWTWTPLALPADLRRRRVDLAHVQYLIPPRAPCPVITTIHDVAFRRFPRLFPPKHRLLLNTLIPLAVRRAAGVLTGSESTRSDLIELFGADPDRVAVAPYAADPMFTPMPRTAAQDWVRSRLGVPAPYVLAVGVLQPRKNLPRLVRAYAALGSEFPHRLVIVGKEGWDDTELRTAASGLDESRAPVFTGYVEDADLRPLYAGADVFAYPSLYEGFGLPPLEAMACGTPVITGNTSSLPEVVGDAAITVNPYDESEIAMALRRMLGDDALRSRLACLGLAQAASFSWARTAAETVRAYERFVGSAKTD